MNYFLSMLALLAMLSSSKAGEQTLAHFKITYQSAYDQADKAELEAHALVKHSTGSSSSEYMVTLPLVLPSRETWCCSFMLPDDQSILQATVEEQVPAKDGTEQKPRTLLAVHLPFKSGADTLLVKNAAYSLTVNIELVDSAAEPTAKVASVPPAGPVPKYLSAEELAKLEISYEVDPGSGVYISGHNPFLTTVTGGVLKVSIPKTDSTPEINREYAFVLEAYSLNDFGTQVQWALRLTDKQKPTFTVEKLQFRP
jgi:hypothetical protein